jgi:hypothetical protein
VVSALHDVAMSGRVRRTRYERAEGLGLQRAQRDLAAADVLTPVGRTRARFYTAGPAFPDSALELARTPLPLADPYTRQGIWQHRRGGLDLHRVVVVEILVDHVGDLGVVWSGGEHEEVGPWWILLDG